MSPDRSGLLRSPEKKDWAEFFVLADGEGWRIPEVERRLLQSTWTASVRALIASDRFCGLVSAIAHEQSGWIGNLIVPPTLRGQGYGLHLFKWALNSLLERGRQSLWLTASEQGRPIYEKEGFSVVDHIERWSLPPGHWRTEETGIADAVTVTLFDLDRAAWDENRQPFLAPLVGGNLVAARNESAALLQRERAMQIIGPWYSRDLCLHANRVVLHQLLASADPSVEIVTDVLASSPLSALLAAAQFKKVGQAALMVYGDRSAIDLSSMVSLASLGSVG